MSASVTFLPAEALVRARRAPRTEPSTRDGERSRRKRDVRAVTVSVKRMTKREIEIGRLMYGDDADLPRRPASRAECAGHVEACPFVSCAHHLFLDVHPVTGNIKFNYPDLEPDELRESCALDVADRGGETLERVGEFMNLTRERIRQIEVRAFAKAGPALRQILGEVNDDAGDDDVHRLEVAVDDARDTFFAESVMDLGPGEFE